jgi:peptide/nickel transport system substrate-binding protein
MKIIGRFIDIIDFQAEDRPRNLRGRPLTMEKSYWSGVVGRRTSRRRALTAMGLTVAAGAVLAACGGGDDGAKDGKATLVSEPEDTTKQARRGGIMKDRALAEPPTLDIFTANNPWNGVGPHMYSALVQFQYGYLKSPENEIVPDLAESWEWSPDGLQIVLKLRQGIKFHNKPPVNGRALDIDDVLFTWDRFTRKSSGRGNIANVIDPRAPVLSLAATDARTVVLKLKEPLVYALGLFASNSSGALTIIPKETDTTFDIRGDMIGTGPFVMTNYTPSVGFTLKRNADYYDKDFAFVEQIDKPIISEYTAVLAQFKSGNIYSFGSHPSSALINSEDVLPVKREEPRILVYPGELRVGGGGSTGNLAFGWLPEGRSPFLDERVRQAISMSYDRDLYIDTFNNVSKFEAEGLPVETRWNTALAATNEGWWLDPKGRDFGANAKYFQHDLAEGKKLLAAAGFPNGFETSSSYLAGGELGTLLPKSAGVLDGMIGELGIRSKTNLVDYSSEYIPRYRDGKGQFEGWAYITTAGGATGGDPVGSLANQFWSKGGTSAFHGFSVGGKNDQSGDPQVDTMIEKARVERDADRRRALVFDIQRYLAKAMYSLQPPGPATTFTVAWPCLANFRVYQGGNNWQNYRLWIDDSKPPFRSA